MQSSISVPGPLILMLKENVISLEKSDWNDLANADHFLILNSSTICFFHRIACPLVQLLVCYLASLSVIKSMRTDTTTVLFTSFFLTLVIVPGR